MDMSGERRIPAPRDKVWAALNDTEILRQSIPGCQEITRHSETEMSAKVAVKLGPVSANFTGKVQLSEIDPPTSYTIGGEGSGGVAGFAKGGAKVRLADAEAGSTLLSYDVNAQVGGKLAQLGARLIDSSAKQMAEQFFDRFSAAVAAREAPPVAADAPGAAPVPPPPPAPASAGISLLDLIPKEPLGLPRVAFVGGALWLGIMALLFLFSK
jgi:hypothetical protein